MKPEKPTSITPDWEDLNPSGMPLRANSAMSRSPDALKKDGGISVAPGVVRAKGTISYNPLPLQSFPESRNNGVAEKARSVGHAAASVMLGELFRAARKRK